ncbi:hypothetical protein BASA81_002334 [Batrachochytrium salamandrivorans]|nr:hypothetical protein BASA81_002334 [Batrachochytrium salamandrivorans]
MRSTRSKAAAAAAAEEPSVKRHRVDETFPGLFAFAEQGNRATMEDCYSSLITSDGSAVVFGVFDGHGGDSCSKLCQQRLCQSLADHPFLARSTKQAFTEVFVTLDDEYCGSLVEGDAGAGSTATVAVFRKFANATKVQPAKYKLSVAWAGDSSAIVLSPSALPSLLPEKGLELQCEQLTNNHNGSRLDERRRIERQGGFCEFHPTDRIYRVDGVLAVTRSLGDATLKPHVCATPEVKEILVGAGDLVIVASDGLWDYCNLDEIIRTVGELGLELGLKQVVARAASTGEDNVCALGFDVSLGIQQLNQE